jgi:tetratricopeptide (TPR) repeat protein
MAFALGNLNEDAKDYKKAVKFYKRFFFCARILEDPVGASLGLNRLGVMYHKLKNYSKSLYTKLTSPTAKALQFHLKHKQFTDNENLFSAYYNVGISLRLLKRYDEAIE